MNVTVTIPSAWLESYGLPGHLHSNNQEVVATLKRVMLHILETPLSDEVINKVGTPLPADTDAGVNHRAMFSLSAVPSSVLQTLATQHRLTAGPTAKRLLGMVARGELQGPAVDQTEKTVDKTHPLAILNQAMQAQESRGSQAQLYDNLWETLTTGKIGIVEGGTGIGKTRAMMACAVRWAKERQANIGICAPTIALLRQLTSEHQRQHDATAGNVPPIRLIIGRREFVGELDLIEFLDDKGKKWDIPALRAWVKSNQTSNPDKTTQTNWQMQSLLDIAPDIPADEVRLGEVCRAEDRGYQTYKAQFIQEDDDSTPTILLFTHAMLAQDMRRKISIAGQDETYRTLQAFYVQAIRDTKGKKRKNDETEFAQIEAIERELGISLNEATNGKGFLPSFTTLMIDEGHLLESSFSSAMSDYLSLSAILGSLHEFKAMGGKITSASIQTVSESIQTLIKNAPGVDRRDFVALASDINSQLIPCLTAIRQVCESIGKVKYVDSEKLRLSLKIRRAGVILGIAASEGRRSSFLRHSPIRELPQIYVSNGNIQSILSRLWSSLQSAAVVSATLYINNNDGPSAKYMASLLKVPNDRLKTFVPVTAPWSTACVQGVWLAQNAPPWLYPPIQNEPGSHIKRTPSERAQAEIDWHKDLATELKRIWETAAGGILVLCTSYATVNAVHAIVTEEGGDLSISMVRASPKHSMRTQTQMFLRLSHSGLKPLWLAVGSAWTGVDIGGHDPWAELFGAPIKAEADNVLTDLVITRLPYGTNQSLSHLIRMRTSPSMPWDLLDASLRLKQALGRLVRRANLPKNRRIFLLDARVTDPTMAGRLVPFIKTFSNYKRNTYEKLSAS
jgi:CRISPR type IV-associated DEAD/DEAH-box helicase Csf4